MVVLALEKTWHDTDTATEEMVKPLLDFILPGCEPRMITGEGRAREATRELVTEMVKHRVLTMGELALYAHGTFDGFLAARGVTPF